MKTKSTASFWIIVIGIGLLICVVGYSAFQTWEFVSHIFPHEGIGMQIGAVLSIDGMCVFCAAAEMFYNFRDERVKHLASGIWFITFIMSLAATIIYVYLGSLDVIQGPLDKTYLYWGYGIVVLAIGIDIAVLTIGIRMELAAGSQGSQGRSVMSMPARPAPKPLPTGGATVGATAMGFHSADSNKEA